MSRSQAIFQLLSILLYWRVAQYFNYFILRSIEANRLTLFCSEVLMMAIFSTCLLSIGIKRVHDLGLSSKQLLRRSPVALLSAMFLKAEPRCNEYGNRQKWIPEKRTIKDVVRFAIMHFSIGYVLLESDFYAVSEDWFIFILRFLCSWMWLPAEWCSEISPVNSQSTEFFTAPISFFPVMAFYSLASSCFFCFVISPILGPILARGRSYLDNARNGNSAT
jgi:hypothetical protein